MQGTERVICIIGGSMQGGSNVSGITLRFDSKQGEIIARGVNLVPMKKGFRLHTLAGANIHTKLQAQLRAVEIEPFEQALTKALAEIEAEEFKS